ncbi:MAG: C4-type zinc ribbon domain-containing protein [Verrucomicrobiota bacterium]
MSPQIESLLILQERDTRLFTLQKEISNIPKEVAAFDLRLQTAQNTFDLKKKTSLSLEAERKKIELEVQAKQQQIGRYRQQQLDTRKNEEFQALGNEIKHAEEAIQSLEDQQLEVMEKIEVAQKQLAVDAEVLKKATSDHQTGKTTLAQKKISLEKSLAEVQVQKQEAESKVEENALRKYQRIIANKKENALVPIRNGNCGGCHMKVTAQTLVAIKGDKELISCDNCGRLVYILE